MKTLSSIAAMALLLGCFLGMSPGQAAETPLPDPTASVAAQHLKQDATCTRCHDESEARPVLSIYQTRHGNSADPNSPTCISCHGASTLHVDGGKGKGSASRPAPDIVFKKTGSDSTVSSAALQETTCLGCHREGQRTHWEGSQHESQGVPCSSCHSVHVKADAVLAKATQPEVCFACHKTQRAQIHRLSTHPIDAGKMACSDCHNPHGSTGPKLMSKGSVNETCYVCHAEKRGPFLWEHSPVVEDCTNCHTPHGSTNTALLKTRMPYLCQECHSGDHSAQVNSGANLQNGKLTTANGNNPLANAAARSQLLGRSCLNCHQLVHGSNHPAGSKFSR